jgi:hypothetical protein
MIVEIVQQVLTTSAVGINPHPNPRFHSAKQQIVSVADL